MLNAKCKMAIQAIHSYRQHLQIQIVCNVHAYIMALSTFQFSLYLELFSFLT